MYKPEIVAKFPKEVQDLARRGVYTLFQSKDGKDLLAQSSGDDCFRFDALGSYGATLPMTVIDFSRYERLDLITADQITAIVKAIK